MDRTLGHDGELMTFLSFHLIPSEIRLDVNGDLIGSGLDRFSRRLRDYSIGTGRIMEMSNEKKVRECLVVMARG